MYSVFDKELRLLSAWICKKIHVSCSSQHKGRSYIDCSTWKYVPTVWVTLISPFKDHTHNRLRSLLYLVKDEGPLSIVFPLSSLYEDPAPSYKGQVCVGILIIFCPCFLLLTKIEGYGYDTIRYLRCDNIDCFFLKKMTMGNCNVFWNEIMINYISSCTLDAVGSSQIFFPTQNFKRAY